MPPGPNKPMNPKRVHVAWGSICKSEAAVMAHENEHIQALAAELEHQRGVELALAEAIDRALADEERVASVISSAQVNRESPRGADAFAFAPTCPQHRRAILISGASQRSQLSTVVPSVHRRCKRLRRMQRRRAYRPSSRGA
jgi:hypothetical protein